MLFAHIDTYIGLTQEKRGEKTRFEAIVQASGLGTGDYLDLYTPALEWMLQCIGHNANQELLDVILKKYKLTNNPLILDHILSSFQPSFISPRALDFSVLIRTANDEYFRRVFYSLSLFLKFPFSFLLSNLFSCNFFNFCAKIIG